MKNLIGCAAKRGTGAFNVLLDVGVLLLLVDIAPAAYPTLDATITCRLGIVSQFRRIDGVFQEIAVAMKKKFSVKTSSCCTGKAITRDE